MQFWSVINRLTTGYFAYAKSKTWHEFRNTALFTMRPAVPNIKRSGTLTFPPPFTSTTDVNLILCNHLSDLDQLLVFNLVDFHTDQKIETKLTGYTHENFKDLYFIGGMVGTVVIGLRKGDTEETIRTKTRHFLDRGFNTFLLFPEGGFLCSKSLAKSLNYQKTLDIPDSERFHHVLYPRMGAYNAFLKEVGTRLKHIIDLTIHYQNYSPATSDGNYVDYPSVLHSYVNKIPAPIVHCKIYKVDAKLFAKMSPQDWLLSIWHKKDHWLRTRREQELKRADPKLFSQRKRDSGMANEK